MSEHKESLTTEYIQQRIDELDIKIDNLIGLRKLYQEELAKR